MFQAKILQYLLAWGTVTLAGVKGRTEIYMPPQLKDTIQRKQSQASSKRKQAPGVTGAKVANSVTNAGYKVALQIHK